MPADAIEHLKRHPLRLWSGWLIGPVAWTVHLMGSYLLVGWVCRSGRHWALHGVTLATAALALWGVWTAWRQWSAAGRSWPRSEDAELGRIRFMAVGGLVVSTLMVALIVAEGVPNFIVGACL